MAVRLLHGDATPARVDDIFQVNDRDREAHLRKEQEATREAAARAAAAATAAAGATTNYPNTSTHTSNPYGATTGQVQMTLETWPDGVILQIIGGQAQGVTNRYAVLRSRQVARGMCTVALILPTGQLDAQSIELHHSEVTLAEIRDNCYVRIVSGPSTGQYGMCVGRFGEDVLVKLDNDEGGQPNLFQPTQVVVVTTRDNA